MFASRLLSDFFCCTRLSGDLLDATCGATTDWTVDTPQQGHTEFEPAGSIGAEGTGIPSAGFIFRFIHGQTGNPIAATSDTCNSEGHWGVLVPEPNAGWPPTTSPGETAVSARVICNSQVMTSNQITFKRAA